MKKQNKRIKLVAHDIEGKTKQKNYQVCAKSNLFLFFFVVAAEAAVPVTPTKTSATSAPPLMQDPVNGHSTVSTPSNEEGKQ